MLCMVVKPRNDADPFTVATPESSKVSREIEDKSLEMETMLLLMMRSVVSAVRLFIDGGSGNVSGVEMNALEGKNTK
jgi:hypothetical protein